MAVAVTEVVTLAVRAVEAMEEAVSPCVVRSTAHRQDGSLSSC